MRWQALGLIVVLWAAIYLPALGSLEIKGEEGRRLLPAVTMLDTGHWIVPQVGGVPYLSKPPLINWLTAAAFWLTGTRSEWAARAPSVLAVLALGVGTVFFLSGWLSPAGALAAAVFELTNVGLMEKGRLAEIEALYLGLYGIAFCAWLGSWRWDMVNGTKPSWRTWTWPWLFLGLGLLTKGPLHLLFFYGLSGAILAFAGRGRDLWNVRHLVGVVLMLALFGAWAWPYLRQTATHGAGGVWWQQFQGRLEVNDTFRLANWLLNVPRGLVNYLPWVVLLPVVWGVVRRQAVLPPSGVARSTKPALPVAFNASTRQAQVDDAILRGLFWGTLGCFLAVSLAPGGQPRYTLPLLVPASILLAAVLANAARADGVHRRPAYPEWLPVVWQRVLIVCLGLAMVGALVAGGMGGGARAGRWSIVLLILLAVGLLLKCSHRWAVQDRLVALIMASAAAMALLTADYALGATHRLRQGESVRPVGRQIEHAVGVAAPVAVLRPGFLPFLFYVQKPIYVQDVAGVAPSAAFLLVRQEEVSAARTALAARQIGSRVVLSVRDKRIKDEGHNHWDLLRLESTGTGGL